MKHKSRIKAITFDLDGTLLATAEIKSRAFAELFSCYGEEIASAVLEDHLRNEGISRFIKFRKWYNQLLDFEYNDEIGRRLSERYDQLILPQIRIAPWMPGAFEFLTQWHKLIPIYVASATPQDQLIDILHSRSMTQLIKGSWGYPTSKVMALEETAKRSNCKPVEVLMVGDSDSDYKASTEAGTRFCRFASTVISSLFPSWSRRCVTNMIELNDMFVFDSNDSSDAQA